MIEDQELHDTIRKMTTLAVEMVSPEHRIKWAARIMHVPDETADDRAVKQAIEKLRAHPEPYVFFEALHAIATGKDFIGLASV